MIKGWRKRQLFEPNNLNKPVIIMIWVALISVLIKIQIGEIPTLSLWEEIQDVKNWSNPFFVFFAVFNTIDDEKECKNAIMGLIFFVILTVVPTLIEAFKIIDFEVIREIQPGRSAGFAEANNYATFLMLFFPILFSNFLFQKNLTNKIIFLISFMLVIMGLILTGSRGGTLSFIVSILAYLCYIKSLKTIKITSIMRLVVVLLIIFTLAFLVAPAHLKELSTKRFNPRNYKDIEEFSNSRIPGLRNTLVLFLESPIWGHGHNTYLSLVKKRQFEIQLASHNEYLVYLTHYGVIGLTIFILILIKIFKHMRYNVKTTPDHWKKVIYISYLAGFLGWAFNMLFGNVFSIRIIFWFYTAIIYKYSLIEMNSRYETGIV
jgi:O-antigen ligase